MEAFCSHGFAQLNLLLFIYTLTLSWQGNIFIDKKTLSGSLGLMFCIFKQLHFSRENMKTSDMLGRGSTVSDGSSRRQNRRVSSLTVLLGKLFIWPKEWAICLWLIIETEKLQSSASACGSITLVSPWLCVVQRWERKSSSAYHPTVARNQNNAFSPWF